MIIVGLIFGLAGLWFGYQYFFGQHKFSLARLLISIWFIAGAVAQLRLSPYENSWSLKFYFILGLFFVVFYFLHRYFLTLWGKKIKPIDAPAQTDSRILAVIILVMTLACIACNVYIYSRFNTLPILSTVPDKMRFIINKEIFGLWEYLALMPRFFIPLTLIYLLIAKPSRRWIKILCWINIVLGFFILSLYASRLIIVFAILMCYFSYLIIRIKEIGFKKIIVASVCVVALVLAISIIIPVVRQHITYRDYYIHENDDAFSYIADLSKLRIPKSLRFITPLYIVPSFNTQALMRSADYYHWPNYYFGAYELSVFNPLLKIFHISIIDITIPWKQIFLPWWITGTFLFSYWVDFGYAGIILAAILWAAMFAAIYVWATKKASLASVLFFAYFSFVIIMSLYTNYFMRQEFYMDIVLIAATSVLVGGGYKKLLLIKKK